jgi:hypothetical protein
MMCDDFSLSLSFHGSELVALARMTPHSLFLGKQLLWKSVLPEVQ